MPLPRSALCLAVLVCGVDGFSLAPAVHGRRGLTSRVGSVVAVESWYDTGERLTEDAKAHAAPVAEGASDGVSVPEACKFMADPTLEGMSVEDKSAFLASKGVDSFVIAQATCVTNEDNVQGHPELPAVDPPAPAPAAPPAPAPAAPPAKVSLFSAMSAVSLPGPRAYKAYDEAISKVKPSLQPQPQP